MNRRYSLKKNRDFRFTYNTGKSQGTKSLVLIYASARHDGIHIGFSVGKKVGGSVVRNKVKRRLRECIRPLIPKMKRGMNLIFIARPPIVDDRFVFMQKTVRTLLTRAGLIAKEAE